MKTLAGQGSIRFWALVVSLTLHAAAIAVFAGIKLSDRLGQTPDAKPSVSLQMVETAIAEPAVVPVPAVEPVSPPEPEPVEEETPEPLVTESAAAKPEPAPTPEPTPRPQTPPEQTLPTAHEVEFFGQRSIAERICFVVDCSGSMYGQMYRVKERLKDSIIKLDPEQAFCVLFFMDGRQVLMSGSGSLDRATVRAKSQAFGLIGKIKPGGSTDAAHALECALRLRDRDRRAPEVIYFLTDGFNLDDDGSTLFVEKVAALRNSLAPGAVLHTIGFWPQPRDREMLKMLAQQTGGGYTEIQ